MTKTEDTKAPTVKVTLLKDGHIHQGKPCKQGDEIDVTERQKAFLAKRDLIDASAGTKTTTTAKSADTSATSK